MLKYIAKKIQSFLSQNPNNYSSTGITFNMQVHPKTKFTIPVKIKYNFWKRFACKCITWKCITQLKKQENVCVSNTNKERNDIFRIIEKFSSILDLTAECCLTITEASSFGSVLKLSGHLTLKVLNFWKFTSYCSLNPNGRAWGKKCRLVPRRPYIPHPLPLCINCRD